MNAFEKGIIVASAVASLMASGTLMAHTAEESGGDGVHDAGINSCKGTGS
jgi:hypothetical protein